jgi:hypothetical protein
VKALLVIFVVVAVVIGVASNSSDDKSAATSDTPIADSAVVHNQDSDKSAEALRINNQIIRLAKRGERVTVRYASNPCAALPQATRIVNRIDDLLWKQRQLGYPNSETEEKNDQARAAVADLIGYCR